MLSLQQSDDISDHYLISFILNLAKVAKSTLSYKYIPSATKDHFINNLPDQFVLASIPDRLEEPDRDRNDSLVQHFSHSGSVSLKKIGGNRGRLWYTELTHPTLELLCRGFIIC